MGQMPGPSYPFQWPGDSPPEQRGWWRWFVFGVVALSLLVLVGLVAIACTGVTARP